MYENQKKPMIGDTVKLRRDVWEIVFLLPDDRYELRYIDPIDGTISRQTKRLEQIREGWQEQLNAWAIPNGLSDNGRNAAQAIYDFCKSRGLLDTGGCKVFYSPAQWAERKELYGLTSELVVVHDGGDHRSALTLDYGILYFDRLFWHLDAIGLFHQQCTGWYSCILKH